MSVLYFGVLFDKFDVLNFRTDFLSGVRANYFNSGNIQQFNNSFQTVDDNEYSFSYNLNYSGPLKWKQILNGKLNQVTKISLDGSYNVDTIDNSNIVYKSIYFNKNHLWVKNDYFENNKLVYTVYPEVINGEDVLILKKFTDGASETIYLYPKYRVPDNRNYCVLAFTDKGFVYFNDIPNNECIKDTEVQEVELPETDSFSFTIDDFTINSNVKFDITSCDYLNYDDFNNAEETQIDDVEQEQIIDEVEELEVVSEPIENYSVEETPQAPNTIVDSCGDNYSYFGETSVEGKRDGYGRTVTSNGKTAYEGSYKNDKRNGFGSFYYKNGDLNYVGNWKDNYRQGFGMGFRSSDFTSHIGNWNNNIPNGIGARFDKDGNFIFLGNFVNGKKEGIGITVDENGRFIVSHFENDQVISSKPLE